VAVLHDGVVPAGRHAFALDGSGLAPGVYVVRVVARPVSGGPAEVVVQRVVLAR